MLPGEAVLAALEREPVHSQLGARRLPKEMHHTCGYGTTKTPQFTYRPPLRYGLYELFGIIIGLVDWRLSRLVYNLINLLRKIGSFALVFNLIFYYNSNQIFSDV